MKNIKIFIFNSASRAATYGIGTYIDQLTSCLNNTKLSFDVIFLHGEGREISVTEEKTYRQITIPAAAYINSKETDYYYRNVTYLLDEYIQQDVNTEYIFQLNFMSNPQFVSCLKKRYKCKFILVSHYTNWSFALYGNESRLLSILSKNTRKRTIEEKQIGKSIEDDIKMIDKCDRFVCVAQHTLDTFLKLSDIDISKCRVVNNALKDEYKEMNLHQKQVLKNKWWIDEKTKIVLFVGRLDDVKGISFLLEAFKRLLKTYPNAHLILAGDGNYSKWLSEASGFWTKITFTGRLGKKKIKELYQIADIGVVCSIHEEFGMVAIEMMMHMVPIIVGDTGGLSEIVEDNITGIKIPIKTNFDKNTISPRLLSAKIKLLLEDHSFAFRLAANGRNIFLQKYEISVFKKNMISLYLGLTE